MKKIIIASLFLPMITFAYSPFKGVEITNSPCEPSATSTYSEMDCQNYIRMGGSGLVPTELTPEWKAQHPVIESVPNQQAQIMPMGNGVVAEDVIATSTQTIESIKTQEMQTLIGLLQQLIALLQAKLNGQSR